MHGDESVMSEESACINFVLFCPRVEDNTRTPPPTFNFLEDWAWVAHNVSLQ